MSDAPPHAATIEPARAVRGRLEVPGDKSISHRYALLSALGDGVSRLTGYAPGDDCAATLSCIEALGATVRASSNGSAGPGPSVEIIGVTGATLQQPHSTLDARNSGTTLRLLAGILASCPFETTVTGDASLRRRPMRRVIDPLTRMGARIESADGRPPLTINGTRLHGLAFAPEVPSAQVKSAILLAGLQADGLTQVIERVPTRDHTERALPAFGVTVKRHAGTVEVQGGQPLRPAQLHIPGDVSSAAFLAVAAAALPGSDIEIVNVGLNPSRTAFLDVLRRAGARVEVQVDDEEAHEPRGRLHVRHSDLRPFEIEPAEVPALIDELPVLAALATFGGGIRVRGAAELRVKESDRIACLVRGFQALGAHATELEDGFEVDGRKRLTGGRADACGDHRLAMAFAIAGLGARGPSHIDGAGSVSISYPGFFRDLGSVRIS